MFPVSTLPGDPTLPTPMWLGYKQSLAIAEEAARAMVSAAEVLLGAITAVRVLGTGGPTREPHHASPMTTEHETLVYELLDAHADTADLAAELSSVPCWAAHL